MGFAGCHVWVEVEEGAGGAVQKGEDLGWGEGEVCGCAEAEGCVRCLGDVRGERWGFGFVEVGVGGHCK